MGLAKAVSDRDDPVVPVDLDDSTVEVRSIGYERWRALIEAHPSKERALRWDRETFVPAALLKCVVDAEDEADVQQFLLAARPGEVEELLGAIVKLHEDKPASPTSPRD